MAQQALVIGCGVIGLSSALKLQQAGVDVSILARDLPPHLTSAIAGAIWYGYSTQPRLQKWAAHSLELYLQLAQDASSGVQIRRLRDVFPYPVETPWFASRLPAFARIPASDLPDGFRDGFLMDVPIIETPTYLAYLQRRFVEAGGLIEQREIASLDELDAPLIINCTGVGARHVAHDEQVYPIRGQVLKVHAPHIQQGYMDDHHFTYLFPRADGLILGGIAQPGNWSLDVDPAISADILARCARVEPSVINAPVLATLVGLRPGRPEPRLELQHTPRASIIHNYGHAGVGVTLSWGCAQEVLELAQTIG